MKGGDPPLPSASTTRYRSSILRDPPKYDNENRDADSTVTSSDLGEKFPHPDCDDESACRFAPLPLGEGIVTSPFLCDEVVEFSSQCFVLEGLGLLPLEGDGRGVDSAG